MDTQEMPMYLGVKQVQATEMSEAQFFNQVKNEYYPENKADRSGYLVVYENGYKSWSPKDVFEKAYRILNALTFGLAVESLKQGKKVARKGWNGKGMYLEVIKGEEVQIHNHGFGQKNELDHSWQERVPEFLPWIGMKTADNKFVPWLASQTDVLAEDWEVLE